MSAAPLKRAQLIIQVWYLSKREWVRREGDNYLENEKTGENKRQG